jgi:hypothetical protein
VPDNDKELLGCVVVVGVLVLVLAGVVVMILADHEGVAAPADSVEDLLAFISGGLCCLGFPLLLSFVFGYLVTHRRR